MSNQREIYCLMSLVLNSFQQAQSCLPLHQNGHVVHQKKIDKVNANYTYYIDYSTLAPSRRTFWDKSTDPARGLFYLYSKHPHFSASPKGIIRKRKKRESISSNKKTMSPLPQCHYRNCIIFHQMMSESSNTT